jgi:hypothetical protein
MKKHPYGPPHAPAGKHPVRAVPAATTPADGGEDHPVRDVLRAWDRFWFTPGDPTTLAVMRIFTGALMLYVHFTYALDLVSYVGPTGWMGQDVMRYARLEFPISAPPNSWDATDVVVSQGQFVWSPYFHLQDPVWIRATHAAVMLVTFLFMIGLASRVTSVLAWMGGVIYIHRSPATVFGIDTMTNLGLLYLMIAPCGAALSVDRWLAVWRLRRQRGAGYVPPPGRYVSATFATRLVQINFCLIYLMAGMSKLLGTTWWAGTAPSLFLLNYSFAPFDTPIYTRTILWMLEHRWLWEVMCSAGVVLTLCVELGLPFLIWNPKLRWLMMCGSVMFHTMIGLLMGLVTFSLMMIILLLAFMPPEVMREILVRLGRWLRQLRSPAGGDGARKADGPLAMAR